MRAIDSGVSSDPLQLAADPWEILSMDAMKEFFDTRSGWLFSLCADSTRGSSWGVVNDFYYEFGDEAKREGSSLVFKAQVYGKVLNRDCHIKKGDGIAFYHSKRALYPLHDKHHRRQRITLMGVVQECHQHGLDVSYLKVSTPEDVYEAFDEEPIVWTQEREKAFVACGLRDGPVRTFYPVPPDAWSMFLSEVAGSVELYTGERPDY